MKAHRLKNEKTVVSETQTGSLQTGTGVEEKATDIISVPPEMSKKEKRDYVNKRLKELRKEMRAKDKKRTNKEIMREMREVRKLLQPSIKSI